MDSPTERRGRSTSRAGVDVNDLFYNDIPHFEVDDVQSLYTADTHDHSDPVLENSMLTPHDRRSWLSLPTHRGSNRPSISIRSRSRSRPSNESEPASPSSVRRLSQTLSRHLSPSRSDYEDAVDYDASFIHSLADDEELDGFKADLKGALGDNDHAGSWLSAPIIGSASRSNNSSKVSLVPAEEGYEMQSYKSKSGANSSLHLQIPTDTIDQPAYSPRPDTVEGVFREFTTKINNRRHPRNPNITRPTEDVLSDDASLSQFTASIHTSTSNLPEPPLILYGKSLRFFEPYSNFRYNVAQFLLKPWFDYSAKLLLLLQTIVLSYRQWSPATMHGYVVFGSNWADWVLLALNVLFTAEIVLKCIAWGAWDDSQLFRAKDMEYDPLVKVLGIETLKRYFFGTEKQIFDEKNKQFKHSMTFQAKSDLKYQGKTHRAYLRSSWNRVDFVSTVCFWINFFLSINRTNAIEHVSLFRALECLRIIRVVNLTERISLILTSIKNGGPQLVDVSLFILYFWILFAIIGTQSFKSSLRRYCVWIDPDDPSHTYQSQQHCGGFRIRNADGSLGKKPYIHSDGSYGSHPKGFLCPVNSECRELENPHNNMYSFDNILNAMQLTFVVMSANTFSNIMYYMMDTDTMAASIYFIFGIFMLFLWMINLLVAVISTSFRATREADAKLSKKQNEARSDFDLSFHFPVSWISKLHWWVYLFCDVLILLSTCFSCIRNKDSSEKHLLWEFHAQSIISLILLIEIIHRFVGYFPKWRMFFKFERNKLDLFLVVATSIMAVPPIHDAMGRGYDWMRAFQLIRFYRVVLRIGFVRKLWARVWSSINTIINLSLFYFLFLFLCSIIFSRYFEGVIPPDEISEYAFPMNTLSNSFLGLFVITTTENWSDIMYSMQAAAPNKSFAFFGAVMFIMWFILSNSVVLSIFIAIIGASLEVSENVKRKEQVKKFILVDFPKKLKQLAQGTVLSEIRDRIFGNEDEEQRHREVEKLLLNGAAVQEFLKDEVNHEVNMDEDGTDLRTLSTNPIVRVWQLSYRHTMNWGPVQKARQLWHMYGGHQNPFFKGAKFTAGDGNYAALAEKFQIETEKTFEARKKFLKENPGFNTSLFFLKPNHPLRRLCQLITKPSVGKRYDGVEPNKIVNMIFLGLISAATLALVIIACYSTPLYRKDNNFDDETWNWTLVVEVTFGVFFALEFFIKIIADGFAFTPNAYLQNSWNQIDWVVLVSIWINVIAIMKNDENLSRVVRGLKALRALRILTISETSKDIFHKVIIAGFWKILSAAFLSFLLIFPFAAWGLNLFTGRLGACNDGELGYDLCVNEFQTTVFDWDIMMPRSYIEPQLELNRFASALLTLFEVLSLEGWTDLLANMVNSTGPRTPMDYYATPSNAVFLVLFIFVGIVFVLTLFISVIIANYAILSGSAFLTLQQTSWNEVTKLLTQIRPKKRPDVRHLNGFRMFCFKYSVEPPRPVKVFMQCVLWLHVLAILIEKFPSYEALDNFRYSVYITSSTLFLNSIIMRLIALGPNTFFKVRWNVYEFFVFLGAFITSFASFFISRNTAYANINKLFLVGIFTVLIHQSNRLSHLLKIASASLPSLLSLIFTWAILFLVYAIALNQIFGLTRLGPNTSGTQNLRTVTKAMILLFKNSFGEGWNYVMHDFAIETPYCVNSGDFASTDCGNMQYAYILFISWNIISMYIFVNMFVSLIFENFSYVYTDNSGAVTLDREEIRAFKTAWCKYDPNGTGFITLEELPRLLRSLDGYFSFKTYEGHWTISELKESYIRVRNESDPYDVDVNVRGLNRALTQLDVFKARQRIQLYERFIEEAKFNMERYDESGVSFQRVILQIPLYARFDENNCLTLTDFLDRLVITRRLNERLEYRRRLETLKMISCRWRYLRLTGKKFNQVKTRFVNPVLSDDINEFGAPAFGSEDIFQTPRSSFSKTDDRTYWSPSPKQAMKRTETDVIEELANISGALGHSQWKNELKSVGNEIDEVLSNTDKEKQREDSPTSDVEEEIYEFDFEKSGAKGERKIT
ncbi:Calcium-channel protein CCH1 [Cyberlindnera fabianii]|uniref:Calcium-channel protein CCH1 n=1 Tax=Cyberlindnera fabianii TaxID=36022 RepID=A0A1V2L1L4_CYBFA|nr:Calcium-channel protein CCH1 [Cyberlindnera fabianii]